MANVTDTYTASGGAIGYGAQFKIGQGDSPETFTSVPAVKSITFGDMTTGVVDVTHLRSPARHREKRATIRDSGPIVCRASYDPDHGAHQQNGGDGFDSTHSLVTLWINVTENNFRIEFPAALNTQILDVRGVVTKYQISEMVVDGEVEVEFEVTPLQDYSSGLP
jgi:hypothetical protein